jgi:hypothetical protein
MRIVVQYSIKNLPLANFLQVIINNKDRCAGSERKFGGVKIKFKISGILQ